MRTERHILLQSWKLIVADRVCSWRSFFWTFFWDLNLFGLVLQHPTAQDTGGAIAHPLARRLSNVSGKNNARDWWRSFKDSPDSQIACVLDSFFLHISYIVTWCFLYYPVVSFFSGPVNRWLFLILHLIHWHSALCLPLTAWCFLGAKYLDPNIEHFSHLTKIRKCNRSEFLWSTKI